MVGTQHNKTNNAPIGGPRRWREQRWLIDETILVTGSSGISRGWAIRWGLSLGNSQPVTLQCCARASVRSPISSPP